MVVCVGALAGFIACCLGGRFVSHRNIYQNFVRLHPYLEQETSYFPTASQLIAVVHAQCPPAGRRIPIIIGGNSVLNGSGQRGNELWSHVLQTELGDHYRVINFSAPGAGIVDNGGVIFEALAREYPHALFVTNTEPGYYKAANRSTYAYLFWDAYYKGLLPHEADAVARNARGKEKAEDREFRLGRWLNSRLYFNDLWTGVAYRWGSTIWTPWLKLNSFAARKSLPDWYDTHGPVEANENAFQKLMPDALEVMRRRRTFSSDRFQRRTDGSLAQTEDSLHSEQRQIADLLPASLHSRSLIVLTPYNPWFVAKLSDQERERMSISFRESANLLAKEGYHALSTADESFIASDFGDTWHLSPSGGQRLAHLVAGAIHSLSGELPIPSLP